MKDGDTVEVLRNGMNAVRIRLSGIDAPEKSQAFGARAKQYASDLAFGKTVTVKESGTDRYGRTLGEVILEDGRSLNHELVRAGLAWWYKQYAPKDKKLEAMELQAKEARVGLWADAGPVPPWEFRRAPKSTQVQSQGQTQSIGTGYWLNTGTGVRHNSRCRYYKKTKQGRPCLKNEGKPCGICGG